jgi:hypothetical protein
VFLSFFGMRAVGSWGFLEARPGKWETLLYWWMVDGGLVFESRSGERGILISVY